MEHLKTCTNFPSMFTSVSRPIWLHRQSEKLWDSARKNHHALLQSIIIGMSDSQGRPWSLKNVIPTVVCVCVCVCGEREYSNHHYTTIYSIPWWLRQLSICLQWGRPRFIPWVRKIPWRRKWQSTPVLLPGTSHGQRSLEGYSPWGRKELDTTERLHVHVQALF